MYDLPKHQGTAIINYKVFIYQYMSAVSEMYFSIPVVKLVSFFVISPQETSVKRSNQL